jgi:multicomponent Na+:H+ antiporter subunit F
VSIVTWVVAALLGLAALLLLVRLTVGPTILDRSVALDVLMSVTICGIALHAAATGTTTGLPVLVALSMVGFVGAVSIARYASGSDDLSAEEDEQQGSGR